MNTSHWLAWVSLLLLAIAALLAAGAIAYAQQLRERHDKVVTGVLQRHTAAAKNAAKLLSTAGIKEGIAAQPLPLHWLNTRFGKLLVAQEDRELLAQCGWMTEREQWTFLVVRAALACVSPVIVSLLMSGSGRALWGALFGLAIGFMLPKWWVKRVALGRRKKIAKELPLFVDLVRLLQGTGMSLDQTLHVVAADFANVMPVMSQEVALANQQYASGRTRERAFSRLSTMYGNDNLVNLTALLRQIDQYGGAVQEPLKIFGERLREQRKSEMKEATGKISVKMTGVMVLTLLPALVIVTAGPGFLAVIRTLGGMSR